MEAKGIANCKLQIAICRLENEPMGTRMSPATACQRIVRQDPWYVRAPLILIATLFLVVMVVLPLINVFYQAFHMGWGVVRTALTDKDTLAAVRLTLTVSSLAVLLNLSFGLAAAWAIA